MDMFLCIVDGFFKEDERDSIDGCHCIEFRFVFPM